MACLDGASERKVEKLCVWMSKYEGGKEVHYNSNQNFINYRPALVAHG